MEQRYARLVKSAALAATVLASSLLLIKIVAWYHTGSVSLLAALAQSMFISGSALFLFLTGFQHLYAPQTLRDPGVGVVVTVIALISTLMLVTYQRWVVRKTRSQAVRADMLHYQSDVMMNG
ncbi:cation transporter, partial [Serratia grimesii]